jgi:hypothetical protein
MHNTLYALWGHSMGQTDATNLMTIDSKRLVQRWLMGSRAGMVQPGATSYF